jgi:hypothetical protein
LRLLKRSVQLLRDMQRIVWLAAVLAPAQARSVVRHHTGKGGNLWLHQRPLDRGERQTGFQNHRCPVVIRAQHGKMQSVAAHVYELAGRDKVSPIVCSGNRLVACTHGTQCCQCDTESK